MMADQQLCPDIAVVVPVMDRWDDLLRSVDSLAGQNYPNYRVLVVSLGADDIPYRIAGHPRIGVLRLPRPRYFSFARTRNIGAQATWSEWLLFMNADNEWTGPDALGQAMLTVRSGDGAEADWYARWRQACGLGPSPAHRHRVGRELPRSCYGHAHGSVLLVARSIFSAIGGYDEHFQDWGFEDTDIVARLEGIGCSRVPMRGVRQRGHSDESRLANFRYKNRKYTWHRNRLFSDVSIRLWGTARSQRPGRVATSLIWTICSVRAGLTLPWLVDVGSESYVDQES
jgi:GT2 family glycosyltransferase